VKILFIIEQFPPVRGGVAVSAKRIMDQIAAAGVEVRVYTFDDQSPMDSRPYVTEDRRLDTPYPVYRVGPFACGRNSDVEEKDKAIGRRNAAHLIAAHAGSMGLDLIHSFCAYNAGFVGTTIAKILGVPHVVSVRGNDVGRNLFHEARFGLIRWTLEQADKITFVNRHLLEAATHAFDIAAKSIIVENSIEVRPLDRLTTLSDSDLRAKYELRGSSAVLGFVGTAREKKGIFLIPPVLEDLADRFDLKCLLVGDFRSRQERERFQSIVCRSHLADVVRITGFVDRAEVADLLCLIDIVLVPSIDDGMPNSLLESMERARPILASSIFDDVITDGKDGVLFRSLDVTHFRERLAWMLENRGSLHEMGLRARQTVLERFTVQRETQAYLKVYEDVGGGSGPCSTRSTPAAWQRVPVFRPAVSPLEKRYVGAVLDSGWWGYGKMARELERRVASLVGAGDALACTSCTAALHLALLLAGVGPGDDVLVPPITFVSTAMAVVYVGARPVFVDVDPLFLQLNPACIQNALTERTKAIILVDYAGVPSLVEEVVLMLKPAGITVIEDAAHAFGATVNGRPVGRAALFTCFSFNAVKNLAAGEGGMLCFADPALRKQVEELSWLGLSRHTYDLSLDVPHRQPAEVRGIGFKYRMADLNAAVALAQLERQPQLQECRRRLVRIYQEELGESSAVELPRERAGTTSSNHMFVIRVPAEVRDSLRGYLAEHGIETAVHYPALNEHAFFRDYGQATPVASAESRRVITLPLFPDLPAVEVRRIASLVREFLR